MSCRLALSGMDRFSYTAAMEHSFAPTRLDIKALAQSASTVSGTICFQGMRASPKACMGPRDLTIAWSARGEWRTGAAGQGEAWLHLTLDTSLPLLCQRCLGPVDIPLSVQRAFRFVTSEEEAQAQDDEVDEDLLVLSREFNLGRNRSRMNC